MKDFDKGFREAGRLWRSLKRCVLCPKLCRSDRISGQKGLCGIDEEVLVSTYLPHHGEEPPLSGERGAGTIFFSSCTMKCVYCQNYQISHAAVGTPVSEERLAQIMLDLEAMGCHNIEAVSPTAHLAGLMKALVLARREGLAVPLVMNLGGYERERILRHLEGLVDIYLPDFKYGTTDAAWRYSGVRDYPGQALAAIREMVRQVGEGLETEGGVAKRGVIVRHLVLPGAWESSRQALKALREAFSPSLPLSIMAQYTPTPKVTKHPLLGRRISREEYERVVNLALDLGFEEIYTQEVDERSLVPDFESPEPFRWTDAPADL